MRQSHIRNFCIFAPIFAPPGDSWGRLPPSYHYRSLQIMHTATLGADATAIFRGITTGALLAAVVVFQRKDLIS